MKILAVDDDRAMCLLLERIITKDDIKCVNTGEEAIALCRTQSFDLVLMDVELGTGMNGIETTRILFAENLVKYPARVWGLSSYTDETYADDMLLAGARDFMPKPIRPKFLLARIKTVQESIDLYRKNQKQTQWWQAIFELLPEPCTVTTMDGTYTEVNHAFVKKIGLPYNEIIGQSPMSLRIISKYERMRFYHELIKKGVLHNMDIVYRHLDGTLFFGSISARIIRNGEDKILSITRDETERKQLQARTEEMSAVIQFYEQIYANLREVTSATDEINKILDFPMQVKKYE